MTETSLIDKTTNNVLHRIIDPITITVNNCYDLEVWAHAIMDKCIADNPGFTGVEVAEMMGISEKSLIRILKKRKTTMKDLRTSLVENNPIKKEIKNSKTIN